MCVEASAGPGPWPPPGPPSSWTGCAWQFAPDTIAIERTKPLSGGSDGFSSSTTSATRQKWGRRKSLASSSSLASDSKVSASTQNQALNALLFLYREVLHKDIGDVNGVVRAKRPRR